MNNEESVIDKGQLHATLTAHLEARLQQQSREGEELLRQASAGNQAFFQALHTRWGETTRQQLQALALYAPHLEKPFSTVAPGALLRIAYKHLSLEVPTGTTPRNHYQSMSGQELSDCFQPINADLAYWWVLPEVAPPYPTGLTFNAQGYDIEVVDGSLMGYEKDTLLGLQAPDYVLGMDDSGYYDERGNSTYPAFDLYQLQILAIY